MHRSIVGITTLALLAGTASAWLPKEHDLAAFKGINKIRGVNFGGMSSLQLLLPPSSDNTSHILFAKLYGSRSINGCIPLTDLFHFIYVHSDFVEY
jgi:hypothetical protein